LINQNGQVIKEPKVSGECRERNLAWLLKNWPSGYQTAFRKSVLTDILQQQYTDYPGFDYHDVLFGMLAPLYGKVVCLDQLLDQHLDYLQKVISRYESVKKIAEERQISEADHRKLARALALTNLRLKLLQSRNPFWALGLMFQIREYRTIKDFISDLVYTYSLNGVARRLLKKFGR